MVTLEFKKDILIKARQRSVLTEEERAQVELRLQEISTSTHTLDVQLQDFPLNYWRAMLDDSRLTANQRAVVARHVFGMQGRPAGADDIYSAEAANPVEFGSTFATLGSKSANCELFLNGRWYPVIAHCQFLEDDSKIARDVQLIVSLSICELTVQRGFMVYRDLFLDELGRPLSRSVLDILHQFGLRRLQTSPAEYNLRLVKAERQSRETGSLLIVTGPVLVASQRAWWAGFESQMLGTPESPRKAIVEAELEIEQDRRSYYSHRGNGQHAQSRLPFVRLFCLEIKRYIYADVDDLAAYEFDTGALESLCLPEEMLSVLNRVFETPVERVFGDLIRGKHGGIVVLASGKPGVGKTLTAEIYAERTQRPLYVLEMGELGTTATDVEEHLRNVFARVTRWNAVLQFDECEIFLAQRQQDLERSAIVGIFLRLLDYYQGMLFLTSNRPEVIDEAVLSRVMLRLAYPDLTPAARTEVWRNMFRAAKLELAGSSFPALAEWELNGRQIRNLTRLAKILFPSGPLTLDKMKEVLTYGATLVACHRRSAALRPERIGDCTLSSVILAGNLFVEKFMSRSMMLGLLVTLAGTALAVQIQEYKSGIVWPEPPVVDPGQPGGPPSDAIVLVDGKSMEAWEGGEKWIIEDGGVTAAKGSITSKQKFGDCQLHAEFATPAEVKGSGQGRGNSGLYLMGRYEVQILDSHENKTYFDGQCGAIYKEQAPTVNASRKPGEWQTYDILFTAPRFNDDGTVKTPGYVTVLHNGVLIHNHFELLGSTSYTEPPKYSKHADKEPLTIQFHGNPVRFRNLWIRENVQPLVGIKPGLQPKDAVK